MSNKLLFLRDFCIFLLNFLVIMLLFLSGNNSNKLRLYSCIALLVKENLQLKSRLEAAEKMINLLIEQNKLLRQRQFGKKNLE